MDKKAIRQYKSGEAGTGIIKLFNVPSVEHYLIVPFDWIELVIAILKEKRYVYKTSTRASDMVIAVQFNKP